MRRLIAWLLAAAALSLAIVSCEIQGKGKSGNYISLLAPDTLRTFDTVLVVAYAAGTDSVLDTVWNAPVRDSSSLRRLRVKNYSGGALDLLIIGIESGFGGYSLRVEYRGEPGGPRVVPSPKWDTLPPTLILKGGDSLGLREGEALSDTGAVCTDERPGALWLTVAGEVDRSMAGRYRLEYACMDRAGNRSAPTAQRIVVRRWPDTLSPTLRLRGRDSLVWIEGTVWADSGAVCNDVHDGVLAAKVTGTVDIGARGEYSLAYACSDATGNAAPGLTRKVRVVRAADPDKPILILSGPDSLAVFQGTAYVDSGASCVDARDGVQAVMMSGAVNTAVRGLYNLTYQCTDSAGNASGQKTRRVRVFRVPDGDKPLISLIGPDSLTAYQGLPYVDSGAACTDVRDGVLPLTREGTVDISKRGQYALRYRCADSAGNAADKERHIVIARLPDALKPILTLRGPDSLLVYDHEPYADSGASCADDRDGVLAVGALGTVDITVRGRYELSFACADSAGNAAQARRIVVIGRKPDPVKPVITLIGSAAPTHDRGTLYTDSGAGCLDDRDGVLPVARLGTVNVAAPGAYSLKFACADSAGNAADTVVRMVTVVAARDAIAPVIALTGPDTIPVLSLTLFADPGASCVDAVDGPVAASRTGFDPPTGTTDGIFRARYACMDAAGNTAEVFRWVKAGMYTASISVTKDASIDTGTDDYNHGHTGMLAMSLADGDQYASIFKFDLSKVAKTGLKSAKLRFVTWARGSSWNWPGTRENYTFKAWALKRAWAEGTGNWFYFDGGWKNGGEDWFIDYNLPAWAKAASTYPGNKTGVQGRDRDLVRPENLTLIKDQTVSLRFDADYWSSMPPLSKLVVLEIDVTDYVKKVNPAQDHGFFMTTVNAPDRVGVLSREVDDGKYATRLMLTY